MTATLCPCCGSSVDVDLPLIDVANNRLSWRDGVVTLHPRPAELLFVLLRAYPAVVSHEDLRRALWGKARPNFERTAMSQIKVRASRALREAGVACEIVNVHGVGYQLRVLP